MGSKGERKSPLVMGCRGAGTPPRLVMQRPDVALADQGSSLIRRYAGGMQRGRAAGPLAKRVMYYFTPLADGRRDAPPWDAVVRSLAASAFFRGVSKIDAQNFS